MFNINNLIGGNMSLLSFILSNDVLLIIGSIFITLIFVATNYTSTRDRKRYIYPSFFGYVLPITIAYVIGVYALLNLLFLFVIPLSLGQSVKPNDFLATKFLSAIFGLMIGFVFGSNLVTKNRKPRHDQGVAIAIMLKSSVNDVKKIADFYFPDTPKKRIWLNRTQKNVENGTFNIEPIPKFWKNKDSVFAYPIVTLDYLDHLAEQKKGDVYIGYENGTPFLYVEK